MAFVTAEINVAVDAVAARAGHLSLHTASPGTTGTNEVTGGSYARVPLTWPAASSGDATATQATVEVPAGTTPTHFGLWSAGSGGTFRGGNALSTTETFTGAGQLKVTVTIDGSST